MKSKHIISLSAATLMALSVAAASGCIEEKPKDEEKPVQLSAPVITLTGNEITWSAVEHADSYVVKESTTTVSTQTELSYTIDKTEAGEYTYTVTATSTDKKYTASTASNSVTYKVEVKPDDTKFEGKIYLVGDSTVCAFEDDYYMPRYGYGTQLYNYLDCKEDQIVNLALSGRSSLSFTYGLDVDEKNKIESITGELSCYEYLTQNIKEGDYLIIGFGHNDEKNEPARFTNPTKTHTDASTENGPSFQYVLNEKYIKVAKDKGATPILCTPIVRYNANPDKYNESNGHITADGDYPEAIRTLGKETGTTVIDLTEITKADYIEKGAEALNYHAYTTYEEVGNYKVAKGEDTTHINYYGAKMVAYEFATALKATDCTLKNLVKADIAAPGEDDFDKAINTNYVKPGYVPFNPEAYEAQYLGEVAGQTWFKTVFGDIGGADKIPSYKTEFAGGKFTVGTEAANGKFSGSSHGFAAVFTQIDASKDFTATAEIKIISKATVGTPNQAGFGMMVRDDIYINDATKVASNCLVAGGVVNKGAIFSYADDAMKNPSSSNAITIEADATFTATIVKAGTTYTLTLSDGTNTYTQEYSTVNLCANDANYVYLCLVANRGIVAEYSNVQIAFAN